MKRDHRIRNVKPGEFRSRLTIDSFKIKPTITESFSEGLVAYVSNQHNIMEEVLFFLNNPVKLPYMNYLYYTRLISIRDPKLYEMVHDFIYINPDIDKLGIKKMTEHIIQYNVKHVKSDNGIYLKSFPVISFEDIYKKVYQYAIKAKDDKPDNVANIVVAYKRDSIFTKEEKITISSRARDDLNTQLHQEIIHNAVNYLVSKESKLLKVTNPRIVKKTTEKGLKSINTITKKMTSETTSLIDEHNKDAQFKTVITYDKYNKYLKIKDKSNRLISKEISVSKDTVSVFRSISE